MAEAIIAFSLAANIIQFLDFTSKLTTRFYQFYKSNREGREDIPDIEKINEDLRDVLKDLESPGTQNDEADADAGLQQLAAECRRVAGDLQQLLNSMNISGSCGKREAVKTAFRLMWKEEEIEGLQKRLEKFRAQLTVHLLASLRRESRESVRQQGLLLEKIESVLQVTQKLEDRMHSRGRAPPGFGSLLLDLLTAKLKLNCEEQASEIQTWKRDLINEVYRGDESGTANVASRPEIPESLKRDLTMRLLARLQYSSMDDRQERIAQAHSATFAWIFKDSSTQNVKWSSFKEWLESDSQLYWITGKPGSGKSTLMKYICQPLDSSGTHAQCTNYLRTWAGNCNLLIANFFFWNSGASIQMTQGGLFRTVVHQILSQAPQMIPSLLPKQWEALSLFNDDLPTDWSDYDIECMLRSAVNHLPKDTKLCLFIDGLDEFDGDHMVLTRLFKDLLTNRNIKLCVASRPWDVFENAFQYNPSLMMQHLTYEDIKAFTTSELYADSGFALLQKREPQYADELVENIVSKASGVFLWVRLVVSSLLAGMNYGDRIIDLQRRLAVLPPELEKLYDKMMDSIDPFYFEHAAQLFKMVRISFNPPSSLLMSFIDEEDWRLAMEQPIRPIPHNEATVRLDTIRRRLNSRTKGFLELSGTRHTPLVDPSTLSADNWTIQYLHRTVKDYIEGPDVQQRLSSSIKADFDPHLRLCAGNLARIKAFDPKTVGLHADSPFWVHLKQCMYSAARVTYSNQEATIELLDELDRTGISFAKSVFKIESDTVDYLSSFSVWDFRLGENGQWAALHPDADRIPFGGHILSLATRYGVFAYVKARANPGCLIQRMNPYSGKPCIYPLIIDALYANIDWAHKHQDSVPNQTMIACLLEKGANLEDVLLPSYSFQPSHTLFLEGYKRKDVDNENTKMFAEAVAGEPAEFYGHYKSFVRGLPLIHEMQHNLRIPRSAPTKAQISTNKPKKYSWISWGV